MTTTADGPARDDAFSRLLIDSSVDGILAFDRDTRYTVWNPAMERLTGLPRDQVLGRRAVDVFPFLQETGEDRYLLDALAGRTATSHDRPFSVPETGRAGFYEGYYAPLHEAGQVVGGLAVIRDVTERKQAAAERARLARERDARLEAERRVALLADAIPQIVYVTADDGTCRYVNRRWQEYTGRAAAGPDDLAAAIHPDDLPALHVRWAAAKAAGQAFETEFRLRRVADGAYRWFLTRAVPVRDADGHVAEWFGTSTDVDDKRRAEEALRLSEQRYRALMEQSPLSTQVFAPDGRTVRVNRAWEELWGLTLDQLGDYNVRHDPQLVAKGIAPYLERGFAGEASPVPPILYDPNETIPERTRHADPRRWVQAFIYPLKDERGQVREVVLIHEDITTRRRAEEALRESEDRLRLALAAADVGTWDYNLVTGALRWDDRCKALFGLPADAAVDYDTYVAGLHPDDRESSQQAIQRALDPAGGVFVLEYRTVGLTDGVERTVAARGRAFFDGGRAVRLIGTIIDVTERRQAEARLRDEIAVTETLNRIGAVLAAELDLQKLLQTVTDETTRLTGAEFGAFFYNVTDAGGEAYTLYTLSGVPREAFARFPMPRNTAIFAPTFAGEGVVRLDDVTADPRYGQNLPHLGMPAGHLPVRSYLAVPVVSRSGQVLGGLFYGHAQPGVFGPRAERIVAGVAAQAAVAIDNARLFRQAQESEQRFRQLAETIDEVFWLADAAKAHVLYVSPAYERVWGRTSRSLYDDPRSFLAGIHPDDRPAVEAAAARQHAGALTDVEYRVVRPDGTVRWVRDRGFPIRDEGGRVTRVAGLAEDVTERREAEQALTLQARVLESMAEGVSLSDEGGTIVFTNPAEDRIFGYARGELVGQHVSAQNTYPPDENERIVAAVIAELKATGVWAGEFSNKRKDGTPFTTTARITALELDGRKHWVCVQEDVTERKRAHRDLQFLADASAALAALVDYESTLQRVARLAVPFFADWCAVDMAGPGGAIRRVAVAHVDPSKVALAHDLHRRMPPDPAAERGVPHILRTGQPEIIPEISDELLAASVTDPELLHIFRELGLRSYLGVPLTVRGTTLGVLTFIAAESGRRYGPADLALAQDLAHRAAVAIDNARLVHELREADRKKDEFLATLAHELRNPLAPIRNTLHILTMNGATGPVLAQARAMMERQVSHLVRLVDDLMDVSRIMRGKISLKKTPVDLATVVARAAEIANPMIDAQGHDLILQLPPDPLRVEGDEIRLAQVVANLLNNASKYADRPGRITVSARRDGDAAVLAVADQGIGIPPDMLPKVFDLFVQVHRPTERTQGGLGIGLSLCRRLVELHGGTITAHSAGLGHGSEFVLRLPLLREGPAAAGVAAVAGPAPAMPRHRVLCVDDNVDACLSLAMMLQMWNQDVETAHDGPAALAKAGAFRPDLVLLDIGLPGLNGYEVCRRLREQPAYRETLIVAITGWGAAEDRRRSREAGFSLHVTKPIDPRVLEGLLQQLPAPDAP